MVLSARAFNVRAFFLGYGAGVLVFGVLSLLGNVLLTDPCRGRTVWAIFIPFVLGPGGFGFMAAFAARRGWGLFGLGLAVASLFPALFAAGLTIGHLREQGCAPEPPQSELDRPVNPSNPFDPKALERQRELSFPKDPARTP